MGQGAHRTGRHPGGGSGSDGRRCPAVCAQHLHRHPLPGSYERPDGALQGNLLELLLRRTSTPVDTAALIAALYQGYQQNTPAPASQGDGLLLVYSPTYQYLSGRRFRQGRYLPGRARLAFQRHPGSAQRASLAARLVPEEAGSNFTEMPDQTCIDWYDSNTGEYITTTGDCSGGGTGGEPPYTGGGVPGPGGYYPPGGGGGG